MALGIFDNGVYFKWIDWVEYEENHIQWYV